MQLFFSRTLVSTLLTPWTYQKALVHELKWNQQIKIHNFNKVQCKWEEKHSIGIYNHQVNKLKQLICNIWNEKYVVNLMNEQ